MANRTLATAVDDRYVLTIERSAAGAPGLFFTITDTDFKQEMTVVVKDGHALLEPVLRWLRKSDKLMHVVDLRLAYDADRHEAMPWLNAEEGLTDSEYEEYMALYRAKVSETTNTTTTKE